MKTNLYLFLLLAFAILPRLAQAQTTYTVTGLVTNARTGEPVPFASVALIGKQSGAVADENGLYKLVVSRLTDSMAGSSMGYATLRRFIDVERESQAIDFKLVPTGCFRCCSRSRYHGTISGLARSRNAKIFVKPASGAYTVSKIFSRYCASRPFTGLRI